MIRGRHYGAQTVQSAAADILECRADATTWYDSDRYRSLVPLNPWGLLSDGSTAGYNYRTLFQWDGTAKIIESSSTIGEGRMQTDMAAIASAKGSFPSMSIMSYPMWYYLSYGRPSSEIVPYITKSYSSLTISDIHNASVAWAQDKRIEMTMKYGATQGEQMINTYKQSLTESSRAGMDRAQAEQLADEAAELVVTLTAEDTYGAVLEEGAEENGTTIDEGSIIPKIAVAMGMGVVGFGAIHWWKGRV